MKSLRALLMLAVAFILFSAALAQDRTVATLPSASAPADDAEWVALRDASRAREPQRAKGVNGVGAAPTRERVVADYLEQADRLQSYVRRNPHRPESREAKRLEALALTHAAWAGDESRKARREGLVAEVRGDRTLPARDRSMLAAYADNLAVRRRQGLSREARLEAFEVVARNLIREFPDVPDGYESLFGIASSRSEQAAVGVAEELLASPAPEHVKQRAAALLQRHSMLGQGIAEALATAPPEARATFEPLRGRRVVIYSWTARSPASVALAKKLAQELPADIGLVGVSLDKDVEAVKAMVESEGWRGAHLFDSAGPQGSTAMALALDGAPLVLVIDAGGLVVSVAGHRDVAKTIAELSSP